MTMLTYTRRMKLIDNHKKGVTKEIILQKLKHSESTYYRMIDLTSRGFLGLFYDSI